MEGQKRVNRRLTPEAYAILNDYFVNVSKWPDPTAQEELAESVRRVPGCEFYTSRQVYSYFANNRAKIRTVGKDAALPTGEPIRRGRRKASRGDLSAGSSRTLSDSAPDSVIHKLDVLLDEEPDPSPEVVEVWAEILGNGVVPEHILTYAFLRRANNTQESEPQLTVWVNEAQAPAQHPEKPVAAPQPLQLAEPSSSVSLDASTSPSPPDGSPHEEPAEHPSPPTAVPHSPLSTNDEQVEENGVVLPASQPSSEPDPSGKENAAGAPTPPLANLTAGPDELVERVRAALLEADTRGARESPKTFVDFACWLKAHHEDRGAVLHTTGPSAHRRA